MFAIYINSNKDNVFCHHFSKQSHNHRIHIKYIQVKVTFLAYWSFVPCCSRRHHSVLPVQYITPYTFYTNTYSSFQTCLSRWSSVNVLSTKWQTLTRYTNWRIQDKQCRCFFVSFYFDANDTCDLHFQTYFYNCSLFSYQYISYNRRQ